MTDRKRFDLRGAVKHCEMQRTLNSRDCGPDACETEERTDRTVVDFRPDGSIERHEYRNPPPNSSEWIHYYDYNDRGLLTVVRGESGGEIKPIRIYEYDSAGRISKLIMPDQGRNQRTFETYTYDADGRKTKTTHIENALATEACGPQGCGTFFGLDGTEAAYGAPGTAGITSIYDEDGRPAEHLFHDAAGELIMRVDFTYDERGNLVEELSTQFKIPPEIASQFNSQQLDEVRSMFRIHQLHRYDAQNRKFEKVVQLGHRVDRETFAYNDHGDMISHISEMTGGKEGRFRYQYDSQGNWTEKIAESIDGEIWSIERRAITYYCA